MIQLSDSTMYTEADIHREAAEQFKKTRKAGQDRFGRKGWSPLPWTLVLHKNGLVTLQVPVKRPDGYVVTHNIAI